MQTLLLQLHHPMPHLHATILTQQPALLHQGQLVLQPALLLLLLQEALLALQPVPPLRQAKQALLQQKVLPLPPLLLPLP